MCCLERGSEAGCPPGAAGRDPAVGVSGMLAQASDFSPWMMRSCVGSSGQAGGQAAGGALMSPHPLGGGTRRSVRDPLTQGGGGV